VARPPACGFPRAVAGRGTPIPLRRTAPLVAWCRPVIPQGCYLDCYLALVFCCVLCVLRLPASPLILSGGLLFVYFFFSFCFFLLYLEPRLSLASVVGLPARHCGTPTGVATMCSVGGHLPLRLLVGPPGPDMAAARWALSNVPAAGGWAQRPPPPCRRPAWMPALTAVVPSPAPTTLPSTAVPLLPPTSRAGAVGRGGGDCGGGGPVMAGGEEAEDGDDGEDSKPSSSPDAGDGEGGGRYGGSAGGRGGGGGGGSGGGGGAGGARGGEGGDGDDDADVATHKFGWHMCLHRLVQPSPSQGGSSGPVRDDPPNVAAGQCSPADFDLTIALSRPLTWDFARNEWRWPKSWRFPDVVVRASRAPSDVDIDAYLTVVTEGAEAGTLLDVGITASDGSSSSVQNARLSRSGECRFSRLRLATTGSAHGGQRFQLFLRLSRADNPSIVLTTVLCTPFSAYSRKNSDRKRRWNHASSSREEPGAVSFAPFEPDVFDRPFVRKVTSAQQGTVEEVVDNSVTGLLRYFRAPNIRNKSRHPVFLAVRFDRVVDLYCNAEAYPADDDAAVRAFIAACGTQFAEPPPTTTETSAAGAAGEATPWMLTLIPGAGNDGRDADEDPAGGEANAQRLFELLSNVKAPLVSCAASPAHLPPGFRRWRDTARLRSVYTSMYAAGAALSATKKRRRAGNYSFRVESSLQAIKAEEVPATGSPPARGAAATGDKTGVGVAGGSSGGSASGVAAVPPVTGSPPGVAAATAAVAAVAAAAAVHASSAPAPQRPVEGLPAGRPSVGGPAAVADASATDPRGAAPPLASAATYTHPPEPPVELPRADAHGTLPPPPGHSLPPASLAPDIKAPLPRAEEPLPPGHPSSSLLADQRRPAGGGEAWNSGEPASGGDAPPPAPRPAFGTPPPYGTGSGRKVADTLVAHVRELHKQQRVSLQRLQSDAFVAVADGDGAVNMRNSFVSVREALLLHATVSGLLFGVLGDRVAGVAESYEFDLAAQLHMVRSLDATLTTEDITSVFMAVNKLVALVTAHLDKVAVHLLPKFEVCFSDEELTPLLHRIRSSGQAAEGFAERLRSLGGTLGRP